MRALAGLCGTVFLFLLLGCGGGGGSAGGGQALKQATRQLNLWVEETASLTRQVDEAYEVTRFRPPRLSATPRQLKEIRRPGVIAGLEAEISASRMREGTDLTMQEAKNIYCFLFGKRLSGELSLDPAVLEQQILDYVWGRFVQQVPREKFRGDIELFASAIEVAESEGQLAVNTAIATVCAYP